MCPHFPLSSPMNFIGEDFYLSQHAMDGHEATGFDVTQLTQDMEQNLFIIKINMPIPVLVYGDAFQWANMVITFYHQI